MDPNDLDAAVRTVYGEAGGESPLGQQAVAGVIANRARASGSSISDVVHAPGQFEPWSSRGDELNSLDPSSPQYQRIAQTISPVLTGQVPDPTGGATQFYSPSLQASLGRKPPAWDDGSGVDIGRHRFFGGRINMDPNDPTADPSVNPATGATWTPDELIKLRLAQGAAGANATPGTGAFAPLSGLFSGIASGLGYGGAESAIRGNQAATNQAYQGAGDITSQDDLAKYLMRSGIPALQAKGFDIYANNLDPIHQADQTLKVLQAKNALLFSQNPYGDVAPPNAATARVPPSQYAPGPGQPTPGAAPTPPPTGAPGISVAPPNPGVTAPPTAATAAAGGAPPITGSVAPSGPPASASAAPSESWTPEQRWALQSLARDKALANNMLMRQQNPQAAAALLSRVQEAEKSGEYMVPGVGMVRIPGHTENAAANKLAETTAQKDAEYYDSQHKGYTGTAVIAAQQKQNLALARQVASDPGFASGSGQALQLATQRALATAGIRPEAAAPREIFNMIMARIKADQLSGLRSMSSEAGEGGTRIFKSFVELESEAMPNESDSQQGILKKLDILDNAGTLAMRWGDMADTYKLASPNGQLDARFDKFMRATIANARIPGYEGTGSGNQEKGGAAPAAAFSEKDLAAKGPGETMAGKDGITRIKGKDGLWHELSGAPAGQAQTPPSPEAMSPEEEQRRFTPQQIQQRRLQAAKQGVANIIGSFKPAYNPNETQQP